MPQIGQATAEAVQKTEGLTTSQFRYGLHTEAPVDLTASQPRVNRILKFKAENAVRKQKEFQAGVSGGKPPTEMDQVAAQLWAALKEGKSLNDLSPSRVAQAYFVLREIDQQGRAGDYFQDAARNIPATNLKERNRIIAEEVMEVKRTIRDMERRLVGRNYKWRSQEFIRHFLHRVWSGTKRPEAREILILDDLIKRPGGNIERAAAVYASDQIEAVLQERGAGVKEAVGEGKVEAAKQSSNPREQKIARAIEDSANLTGKALKKRREINTWTTAEEYRKFIGSQLTEGELSNEDIALAIIESNPRVLERIQKHPLCPNVKSVEDFRQWLSRLDTDPNKLLKIKRIADFTVRSLRMDFSFNSVTDTAFDILTKLGDKLPEPAERAAAAKKPELTAEAGKGAGSGEIVLAIAKGMSETEMQKAGFDLKAAERIRRKYFYKDAAGQHQVKKAEDNTVVKAEEEAQKTAIYGKYKTEVDKKKAELAGKAADQAMADLTLANEVILDSVTYKLGELAAKYANSIKLNGKTTWDPSELVMIQARPEYQNILRAIKQEFANTHFNVPRWLNQDQTTWAAVDDFLKTNDAAAAEYSYSVESIKVDDLAKVGTETVAVLYTDNKLKGTKVNEVINKVGRMDVEALITPTAPPKLENSNNLAKVLAAKKGVPLLYLAMLISMGMMQSEHALQSLTDSGRDDDATELQKLIA